MRQVRRKKKASAVPAVRKSQRSSLRAMAAARLFWLLASFGSIRTTSENSTNAFSSLPTIFGPGTDRFQLKSAEFFMPKLSIVSLVYDVV
jgi:hypothetical protein